MLARLGEVEIEVQSMSRRIKHLTAVCIGSLLICAGCALKAPERSSPDAPAAFDTEVPSDATTGGRAAWPGKDWYQGFKSSELDALIAQATAENLDLAQARARLLQANARARQAGAALLPSVDATANGNYYAGHSVNGSAHEFDWSALLSASYEIDFWGKNRAAAKAGRFLEASARADRDSIALTTLAGVADGYFEVLSLRERSQIAESNLQAAGGLFEVVQARFQNGLANPVELATQRSVLATAQLVLPELKQREEEARTALAVLLGRPPEGFRIEGRSLDSLAEPHVTPGLPAELITRRPDVFMAEANLRAADADLVAARAALLPSVTLTPAAGIQNPAVNAAITALPGVGPGLNLGAGLVQTIFDGGRLRAARDEVRAKDEELVLRYRAAILGSLVDVENALGALGTLDDARDFQNENVTQSEHAYEGAKLRYREGAGDFLAVLEAQRTLYAARDQYAQYRLARLQATVSLCKALGGGWQLSGDHVH
jgi:NodT family efflux transporter outer membrane factor (OMF) lipoprotein